MLFALLTLNAQPTCTIPQGKTKLSNFEILNPNGTPNTNTTGPNDQRLVYWVHGLGGNSGSWKKAADASEHKEWNQGGFQARKLRSIITEYDEQGSVLIAASELRQSIDNAASSQNEGTDPNLNFLIAHSQGGIVSNALLYKDFDPNNFLPEEERYYGGLVTVSSPLQGARIINNTPNLLVMSEEACLALTAGPKKEVTGNPIFKIIDFLAFNADLQATATTLTQDACGFIKDELVPILFKGNLVPTTQDFYVGAPTLEWFNERNTPGIERIAFYGVEEDTENLMQKTMDYFIKGPNSAEYGYWGANADEGKIYDIFEANKLKYESKCWDYKLHQDYLENVWGCPNNGLFSVFACFNYSSTKAKKNAWRKGVDWFENVNDVYMLNIGALEMDWSPNTTCHCGWNPLPGVLQNVWTVYDGACTGDEFFCDFSYTQGTLELIEKESDGVVLAESSSNMPFATRPPVKLSNLTHMQVRNNTAIKDALTQLYNGDHGEFFTTNPKD